METPLIKAKPSCKSLQNTQFSNLVLEISRQNLPSSSSYFYLIIVLMTRYVCATRFSSQPEFKNRGSQQPCITKRFVSISTRLIKGDTVRLIFLTCITMMTKKKMQHLKATSTTSFFSRMVECGWLENIIFLISAWRERESNEKERRDKTT